MASVFDIYIQRAIPKGLHTRCTDTMYHVKLLFMWQDEFQVANAGIQIQRMREQPLETAGFAGSKAVLPPPAALQIRAQFVSGIGIRPSGKKRGFARLTAAFAAAPNSRPAASIL